MTPRGCLAQTTHTQKVPSGGFGHWQGPLIPLGCQLSAVPNRPSVTEVVRKRHMVLEIRSGLDWAQSLGHSSLELGLKTTGVNAAFIYCCVTPKAKSTDPPQTYPGTVN